MNADELAAIRRRLDAATPGPWRGAGDKVRATAAAALIEDNILVAYSTGHDHRLGLKTTGVAADIDLIANAPADLAALLGDAEKLNEVREFHRNWGDQDTDTLDGLDLWEQLGRLLGVTP
jgi:hypothetical protein